MVNKEREDKELSTQGEKAEERAADKGGDTVIKKTVDKKNRVRSSHGLKLRAHMFRKKGQI